MSSCWCSDERRTAVKYVVRQAKQDEARVKERVVVDDDRWEP